MGLGKILIRLAASIALLFGIVWAIPQLAPQVPEQYEGVQALPPASPSATGSTTEPPPLPPLPPGFPSMNRPPPKIDVPDGQLQPIATKFGWTYEIPADWRNFSTGTAGWSNGDRSVAYGASADYGYGYCPEVDGSSLAESGMTGRAPAALDTDLRAAGPHRVTADLLARLASSPRASIALAHYAGRVASGECSWKRIEVDADPLPQEVDELKADPQVEWPDNWPTPTVEADVSSQPYRIPWQ